MPTVDRARPLMPVVEYTLSVLLVLVCTPALANVITCEATL
ncbi:MULTISPECIES: hypothetical protein [unclassified Polynucleobacter]|nr:MULTISPECIES: hypothetical protein [unclassified Polynucleobacter]